MLNAKEIAQIIEDSELDFFGIRIDTVKYEVGEIAENSHELYQDPVYDESGEELLYPYCEEGKYKGYYDAGELDGTSAIRINSASEASISEALDIVKQYSGAYIHVLGGDSAQSGNDMDEIIIEEAIVLAVFEK